MEKRLEFKKLNKKLTDVCYKLIENQDLCKLISIDTTTPLSAPDIKNAEDLIFDRIMPYYNDPNTITDTRTILSVYFDYIKGDSYAYNSMVLNFMILTHSSSLLRIEGGSRVYEIIDTLLESFDNLSGLGLGTLSLDTVKLYAPNKEYNGAIASFRLNEFR